MNQETDAWAAWSTRMLTIYPRHRSNYLLHRTQSTSVPSLTTSELEPPHSCKHIAGKNSSKNNKRNKCDVNHNVLNYEIRGKLRIAPFDSHLSRCAAGEFVTMTNVLDKTCSRSKPVTRHAGKEYEPHNNRFNTNKHSSLYTYSHYGKSKQISKARNEFFGDTEEESLQSEMLHELVHEQIQQSSARARPLSAVSMLRPASSQRRLVSWHGWRFVTEELRLKQQMCHTHLSTNEQKCKIASLLRKEEQNININYMPIKQNDWFSEEKCINEAEVKDENQCQCKSEKLSCCQELKECKEEQELENEEEQHLSYHFVEETQKTCEPLAERFDKQVNEQNVEVKLLNKDESVNCADTHVKQLSTEDQESVTCISKQSHSGSGEKLCETLNTSLTNAADKLNYSDAERKRLLELSSLLREIEFRDYFLQHHPLRSMKSRKMHRQCSPLNM